MEKLQLTTLYYLVDQKELSKIVDTNYKQIPLRNQPQNICCFLLNQFYAEQLAHDWNNNGFDFTYAVHVIAIDLPAAYLEQFSVQKLSTEQENELWILPTEMATLNSKILGRIKLVKSFFGERVIKIAI